MTIIGISGEAGSGKDILASIYERLTNASTISLSDLVRTELTMMGGRTDRSLQSTVANYRRQTIGSTYWIDKALKLAQHKSDNLLLTGIYAPDEARYIQRLGGIVIWIESSEEHRLKRIAERQDEPNDNIQHSIAFTNQLAMEKGSSNLPGSIVSLTDIKCMANYTVQNDSDLVDFETRIKDLIDMIDSEETMRRGGNLVLLASSELTGYDADTPWADSIEGLATLLKTQFFEEFLGGNDSFISGENSEINNGLSLNDAVKVFFKPNLRSITGNQTAKRFASVFEEEQPDLALTKLRSIKPSNIEEEYFSSLTDQEFYDLHLKAQIKWIAHREEIESQIPTRLERIRKTDKMQFAGSKDRSICRLRQDGVLFSVAKDDLDRCMNLNNNPILAVRPILEFVKNEKIFQVSGFKNSKASVVIHDIIDHMFTFDLLDRIGLLRKYHVLFDSIGNPEKIDLIKREGEIVASISYGVRAFQGVAPGFRPLLGSKDIVRLVREMRGRLSDIHTEALRIVNNLESDGPEWRSLGYTYSNYLTELDEQRRNYGCIKYRDPQSHRVKGELDPFSPDYLCFFIETHHALLDSANKHRNALFYAHYIMEEYLRSLSEGSDAKRLIRITPDLLNGHSLRYSNLVPKPVSEWMYQHYGFTANRNLV